MSCPPSCNTARRATGSQARAIAAISRCRVSQDNSRNTSRTSCAPSSNAGATNPIMANVAHGLNPSMVTALAAHFRALDPRPIGGAPRQSLSTGKRIFDDGIPEANVPACSACHGTDGRGQNEIPRLAGQLYQYTVGQLSGWSKERGQGSAVDTSAIMAPTAHNLTRSQVEAVAAYVASQP